MKLIQRYLLDIFLRRFALALAVFVGLYLLIEFFERVDNFIEHQAAPSLYVAYFLNKIPLIISQVSPLACLMGVFMTLGGLNRSNELAAMQAGGISLRRIVAPMLLFAVGMTLLMLAANEYLVPETVRKSTYILRSRVAGRPSAVFRRDNIWLREGQKIIHIRLAAPETQSLQGVTILQFDDLFRVQMRTDAMTAIYSERGWQAHEVTERRFAVQTGDLLEERRLPERPLALELAPDDFRVPGNRRNEDLTISELAKLAAKLQKEGYNPLRFQVDMHARIAGPFANIIMAFLAVPFAIRKGRGISLGLGIALSIGIGTTYFIVHAALLAFGYSATFPPLVAAWAANLLFVLAAAWLFLTTDT